MNLEEFLKKLDVDDVHVTEYKDLHDYDYKSYTLRVWDEDDERWYNCHLDLPMKDTRPVFVGGHKSSSWDVALATIRTQLSGGRL